MDSGAPGDADRPVAGVAVGIRIKTTSEVVFTTSAENYLRGRFADRGHNSRVTLPPGDDLATLEAALLARLQAPLPGAVVQRRFCPQPTRTAWDPAAQPPDARRAGALLLLYPGAQGTSIVLTQRHADLPHHGGQISLPGGGLHSGESPVEGALREAQEEIGLDPSDVRVVGSLSTLWVIVSRFVVHPIVAVAPARPAFAPAPGEVASLIEAPLAALRDPAGLKWDRRLRPQPGGQPGLPIWVPYFDVGGHQVWGATAMILGEFAALLDPSFGPGPAPEPSGLRYSR